MAQEYDVAKSSISPIVISTSKILVSSKNFSLPKKVENIKDNSENRIIDATETKIDRPKNKQEDWYSGERRCMQLRLE